MSHSTPSTSAPPASKVRVYVGTQEQICANVAGMFVSEYQRIAPHRRFTVMTATGGTMEPIYEYLAAAGRGIVHGEQINSFGLDSYRGLPEGHPEQYHSFMAKRFWGPLGIPNNQRFLPDESNYLQYDSMIRGTDGGGIDFGFLGIGPKPVDKPGGHAGFNEAGSKRDSQTRIVQLAYETLMANGRYFGGAENVPKEAYTMGLASIFDLAAKLVLVAFGEAKAEAIRAAVEGPVCEDCPSSYIQTHGNVSVFIDLAAASLLTHTPLLQLAS